MPRKFLVIQLRFNYSSIIVKFPKMHPFNSIPPFRSNQWRPWGLDIGVRVLDSENIGWQSGRSRFDCDGVRQAVRHYLERGIELVVVCVRDAVEDMLHKGFGTYIPDRAGQARHVTYGIVVVRSAPPLDDVLVLKEAQKHNCPIVSNDK